VNQGWYGHPLHEGLSLVTPPGVEPLSLDDAKNVCRVEITDDDTLITSLIAAARKVCESYTKSQFITAHYQLVLDQFPVTGNIWQFIGMPISLPMPPVQSVTSIQYLDSQGNLQTLDTSRYLVDVVSQPARIAPAFFQPWPITRPQMSAVQVNYVAGFGDDAADVPDVYKVAIGQLVAHWYRNREAVSEGSFSALPLAVESLLTSAMPGIYS
jgi:uncharacterized phiE125 gp8 family phage protein